MTEIVSPALAAGRRHLLLAGVSVVAAAAGAGLAWWRLRPDAAEADVPPALWSQSFDTPTGGSLSLSAFRGRPLLLNFWATWCPPCVEEMPLLDAFWQQQQASGWQVVGLAIDQPSAVRQFLARTPVRYPIGMAGLGGTELAKMLGNTSGGLPFTVVLSPGGAVRERRMGRLSRTDLQQWAVAA
jgi:thiol-disulfide isomerase/thioredoxin